jgi:GNAT superfamily N-acetyltransferase
MLTFRTIDHWDEGVWKLAEPVYTAAFPPSTSKKPGLIRSMLERRICYLHVAQLGGETVAMAISAIDRKYRALIIDYLAVAESARRQGVGREFLECIARWAADEQRLDGIIIEVEAEPAEQNLQRIRFWERCGFTLTDYVHTYIWVPEPYRAMYRKLSPDAKLPADGKALFRAITDFHQKAYRG